APLTDGERRGHVTSHLPVPVERVSFVDHHTCHAAAAYFGSPFEGRPALVPVPSKKSATSRPSLRSSPWIRGAPQSGLAAAIRMIRTLISALTGGRPRVGRPETLVQCSRNRRRCHRRMVSGVTITRGCRHPAQTLASATQKSRSVVRSFGRGAVRL